MPRTSGVSARVMRALAAHPNSDVAIYQLMVDSGIDNEQQVRKAVSYLGSRGANITRVNGSVVRYCPTPKEETKHSNSKRIFEELGVSRDGRVVIQDLEGKLYTATEL